MPSDRLYLYLLPLHKKVFLYLPLMGTFVKDIIDGGKLIYLYLRMYFEKFNIDVSGKPCASINLGEFRKAI